MHNCPQVNTDAMLVTVTLCLWTSGIIQIGIVVTERKAGQSNSCLVVCILLDRCLKLPVEEIYQTLTHVFIYNLMV